MGGLICVIGQIILDVTKLTPAHILVIFLTSGVLLGAIGLYEPLVKYGGKLGGLQFPYLDLVMH